MPIADAQSDEDLIERRLLRLEHRYRRAQTALANAQAVYAALHEYSGPTALQLHQAQQQVERAQWHLLALQSGIELTAAQQDVA